MSHNTQIVISVVLGLMLLASISARRDLIRQRLRYVFGMLGVALCTFAIAQKFTTDQTKAALVAVVLGLIIGSQFKPRHSRYISRRDRRRVIAEFERSGERYDTKKHEIDHVVPYSRGGGNTADNLRLIAKAKNRSKSNRSPWWDLFG